MEPPDDGGVEPILSHLEKVTGEAAEAVTEASADAIRLRRALDTLPQGVIVCDENGDVAFRNARAVALMSNRHGDALAAQAVTELLESAWHDGSAERTLDLYGPPRQTLTVRTRLIDDGRRPLGVIAIIEDVSERRRLEEIRRDFVANVSHEMKTPVGALGLLAETLTVEPDPVVAQRLASRIQAEAFRVSRIIDDLLDLSRIESEETPPREPIYINLVMAEAVERVRSAAEQRRITIELYEPDPPVYVIGDRRQLVSAIHSLLENAVNFSYEDSVVRVSGSQVDGDVKLAVTDSGVGIPARDLDRIFERFYRVDHGRSRETGGTGLGLSIVRHVASNHQGRVEVDSREGEGSTFTLVLPPPARVHPLSEAPMPTDPSHTKVLLAEDEESFIDALVVGLAREGFDVTVARDGNEALKLFDEVAPDLILLDLMLPKLSGIDVCRSIRSRSSVPIIMVTAKGTEIDTVVGLEVGADDYVAKPYRLRELVARMRAVLRRTPAPAHAAAPAGTAEAPVTSGVDGPRAPGRGVLESGGIQVDPDRHLVFVRGEDVHLRRKEFELLSLLMENAGRVLTRDVLIDRVWGSDYYGDTKTLDVHIKRLRTHVEEDPSTPRLITTIRGVGYRFDAPRD